MLIGQLVFRFTINKYHYRPPTKLLEGNVFSRVCLVILFIGGEGPHVTIIHDALDITVQANPPPPPTWDMETPPGPPPAMGPPASDMIWWSSRETCLNLFIGSHCTSLLPPHPILPDCFLFENIHSPCDLSARSE